MQISVSIKGLTLAQLADLEKICKRMNPNASFDQDDGRGRLNVSLYFDEKDKQKPSIKKERAEMTTLLTSLAKIIQ
jgi:hypothetical protein